jgi:hypothetical protein
VADGVNSWRHKQSKRNYKGTSREHPHTHGRNIAGLLDKPAKCVAVANPRHSQQNESRNNAGWQRKHHRVQLVIAIGGLLGLVLLSLQWREMQKSTRAATDAISLTRETEHLDQRAWVSTIQVPNSDVLATGVKWATRIPIKNTGKTFARKVGMDCQLQLVKAGNKVNFKMPKDPTAGAPLTDLLLSPGGEYTFTYLTLDPVDERRMAVIKSPEKGHAVLYGYITYYDIFDCVHWTIFCFKFDGEHSVWEICNEHNDADNDRCE